MSVQRNRPLMGIVVTEVVADADLGEYLVKAHRAGARFRGASMVRLDESGRRVFDVTMVWS